MSVKRIAKEAVQYQQSRPKDAIVITDTAAAKVALLVNEEGNPQLKLRVFITGGGCSGFQYGFTFDEAINDDDVVMKKYIGATVKQQDDQESQGGGTNMMTLLIDSISFPYLIGATIDYKEDLQGSRFVIINPNAKTTCGCGASFSLN